MSSNRSKPFSGKQKKEQLQLKKQIKNLKLKKNQTKEDSWETEVVSNETKTDKKRGPINLKSDWDVVGAAITNPRYNPDYQTEIKPLDKDWRHVTFESVFGTDSSSLEIPLRPDWDYNLSKDQLEDSENRYFQSWIKETYSKVYDRGKLSFFEHNLEVWRQLWRVCEISNVLVIVADIRNPIVHLPPSFCNFVTKKLGKPLIIALTKSDLVSAKLRDEWRKYILEKFSGISVHFVSTFDAIDVRGTKIQKRYIKATGVVELCEDIKSFSSMPSLEKQWENIIISIKSRIEDDAQCSKLSTEGPKTDNLFTIGFIGQPNVGKSSLINSIFGRKVVSASRTPGHTKHFQTLHLSAGIRVCDSPGLVFPSIIDKNLQILSGLYNIAQVKDPYGPVLYLCKRVDLFKKLKIPRSQDPDEPNSVFHICEEFARKSGFFTSKAGRPDTYRAANFILRQVIDGKILISWTPTGFDDIEETLDCDEFTHSSSETSDEEDYNEIENDIEDFQSKCSFSIFNEILE